MLPCRSFPVGPLSAAHSCVVCCVWQGAVAAVANSQGVAGAVDEAHPSEVTKRERSIRHTVCFKLSLFPLVRSYSIKLSPTPQRVEWNLEP